MIIKTLVENTSFKDVFASEHGLSLYIETGSRKVLFDMGKTDLFAINASLMGIDLAAVDTAVVSHGHSDHGGGLATFLNINSKAAVYINEKAFEPHFSASDISLNTSLKSNKQLYFTGDTCFIDDGLELFTFNSLQPFYGTNSYGLTMIRNGVRMPDDFKHEQYLSIHENGRHIFISGCSHKGVLNIMKWLEHDIPDVFIGGFHFMKIDIEHDHNVLDCAAKLLKEYNTEFYTCHCTGIEQYEYLHSIMGNKLKYLSAGQELYL
jgi:7,8-dihydropterin-6-yl-methyl-4-(beta-D-ribofuranosyl)aminobenzene 5'-phosphate synthase